MLWMWGGERNGSCEVIRSLYAMVRGCAECRECCLWSGCSGVVGWGNLVAGQRAGVWWPHALQVELKWKCTI